jgi:hypothetical protein
MPSDPNNPHFCFICGKELSLKDAKTDDHGHAVHELCYIAQLCSETEKNKERLTTKCNGH